MLLSQFARTKGAKDKKERKKRSKLLIGAGAGAGLTGVLAGTSKLSNSQSNKLNKLVNGSLQDSFGAEITNRRKLADKLYEINKRIKYNVLSLRAGEKKLKSGRITPDDRLYKQIKQDHTQDLKENWLARRKTQKQLTQSKARVIDLNNKGKKLLSKSRLYSKIGGYTGKGAKIAGIGTALLGTGYLAKKGIDKLSQYEIRKKNN